MEEFRVAILLELVSDMGCLARLPDDGIVDRKTGFLIPDDSCFPLVGNTDSFNLIRTHTTLDKGARDDGLNRVPDFIGIVLYPAWFWKDLGEFFLVATNFFTLLIKDDGTGTSCSLVDGHDEFFC